MAVSELRFIGTGRPVNPSTNPRLNREPSRAGILNSGVKTVREFQEMIGRKLDIPPIQLGKNASNIAKAYRSGVDFTI